MPLRIIASLLFMLAIVLPAQLLAVEEYWEYTFRPGDSIWKIAEKYTTSANNFTEIQRINQIRQGPDRKIQPGTRIVIPVSMLKQQPTPARVIAVTGDASLVRANGDRDEIKIGTLLYSGDRVVTHDQQSLRMQFADKSELQVLSNSEVVLDKLSHHRKSGMVDTRIRLNSGAVNTEVEKQNGESRFEIKTPAAVTAVRGTAYRLSSDAHQISRTEVTEGLVGVSAGGVEKAVKEGFGIIAEKGKPLSDPVKLLAAPSIGDNLSADMTLLKLSWSALDGAERYRYQLASDEKFNQLVIESTTLDTSIEISELTPGRYYLRVRGIDGNRLEGVDAVRDFEILQVAEDDGSPWDIVIPIGTLLNVL